MTRAILHVFSRAIDQVGHFLPVHDSTTPLITNA
jgi:hypothetical protein